MCVYLGSSLVGWQHPLDMVPKRVLPLLLLQPPSPKCLVIGVCELGLEVLLAGLVDFLIALAPSIVPALFVIPVLFKACGHTFEIFTIVAEIDDDMDLVFGFKNMVETEGMLNTRTGEYDFIGRSTPIFPQNDLDVPAGEKAYIKVKAPFCDKLSGMICTKFFSRDMVYTLRVKFQDSQGVVQFKNGSNKTVQLRKDKAVGIPDLRSIGYFKVGYQNMVNMAESSKTFKMYHYKQIKGKAKTPITYSDSSTCSHKLWHIM